MITSTIAEKPEIEPETEPITWMIWKKKRYIVAFMVFLGMIANYSIRILMSIAIVAMTDPIEVYNENGTVSFVPEFTWDSREKGIILSSIFYGYTLSQFIGGYLSCKFNGSLIYSSALGLASLLTLFTPSFASYGKAAFIILRAVVGLCEGAAFSSVMGVYNQWAPPSERSILTSIGFAGMQFGTVLAMIFGGILAKSFGWRSIFYVFGGYGCIWCILWFTFIRKSPSNDRFMSEDERRYINETLKNSKFTEKVLVPWKCIFTSSAVYAFAVACVSEGWGFFTLLTSLPLFIKDTMHVNIRSSGILSATPYICMSIALIIAGPLADYLRTKGRMSTNQVRRYFTVFSFLGQAFFLILVAYLMNPVGSMICMVISIGLGGFAFNGYMICPLDMAPQFATLISGIGHTTAAIAGIVTPTLTGYIVQNKEVSEWQMVFYIASSVFVFGATVFYFFGSAKLQPWAVESNKASISITMNADDCV